MTANATTQIAFTVYGKTEPAGSKNSYVPLDRNGNPYRRAGGGVMVQTVDANKNAKSWKSQVAAAAGAAYRGELLTGPLKVTFQFFRPRPGGHFTSKGQLSKAGREAIAPTTKPDVLKLARAVEDACTGVLWRDDAQIVLEVLAKEWGEPARVEVIVETYQRDPRLF